jgi:hypothetical protein
MQQTPATRVPPGTKTGQMARELGGKRLALQVLHSAAGFYLGTLDEDGLPYSRESLEYWTYRHLAEDALDTGNWTQRDEP